METAFITCNNSPRLILLFLGWGMDSTPFRSLSKPGYDILAVSDYTGIDTTPAHSFFKGLASIAGTYREIVVVAWSFGVRAATGFIESFRSGLPITRTIAVNGTTSHVHDTLGIPQAIFRGTLEGLSEASVGKFRRRMFLSASQANGFMDSLPRRSFESLRDELESFAALESVDSRELWNMAVIGDADRIFPPSNQLEAWKGCRITVFDEEPHFPDFNDILRRFVVDKELVAHRFADAVSTYGDNSMPQAREAATLWRLTRPHLNLPATKLNVLEVGIGNGTLTGQYINELSPCSLTLWDIADIPAESLPPHAAFRCCDAETAVRECTADSFDLILSASTLQWFNSPETFVAEAARILRKNGILSLSFYGPGTFSEIAETTGETLCYPSRSSLTESAAKAGLRVLESSESAFTETFESIPALLRHMRLTGVNALSRQDSTSSAASALRMLRRYPLNPDGSVPLTYCPVHLILQKG